MSKFIVLSLLGAGTLMGGASAVPVYKYSFESYGKSISEEKMSPSSAQEYMDNTELSTEEKISILTEIKRDLLLEIGKYEDILNIQEKAVSSIAKEKLHTEGKLVGLEEKWKQLEFKHEALVAEMTVEEQERGSLEEALKECKETLESEKKLLAEAKENKGDLEKGIKEVEDRVKVLEQKKSNLESRIKVLEGKFSRSSKTLGTTQKRTGDLSNGIRGLTNRMVELKELKKK